MTQHIKPIEPLQRIVVGVDFTIAGDGALRHAMQLARAFPGSELHPTYVIEQGRDMALDALNVALQNQFVELRQRVEQVCAPSGSEDAVSQEFVFHVRVGNAARALQQVAVDVNANLIVVGTHGRRGVEKLLLGSVAEELLRVAHLPVMVAIPKNFAGARPSERPEPPRPGEDLHSGSLMHRAHIELMPRTSHISGLL